jgi:short subunit dehydrogenase-like uncharacterized protein
MTDTRTDEVWILGATGRVGRALAERLSRQGLAGIVLVGRSEDGLRRVAENLTTEVRLIVLDGFDSMTEAVQRERPRVVVNLLGTYGETAPALARACMPGGAYIDLANDLTALKVLVGMHEEAKRNESTLISGAGFGVLATEAIVVQLCDGRPTPASVRVDALASFAPEDGVVGEAFAQTLVDVITTGGRSYRDGRLVPIRLASNFHRHTLPDGTTVASSAVPSGELFAAQIVSGAPNVDFTSALAPSAPMVRALLPLMTRLLRLPAMRRMMVRLMAASKTTAAPRPRPHSWGHAVVTWPDGTVREGWLRADDAMDYTADALAAVTIALTSDVAPHGAFTPAAAFGARIAIDAGGTLIDG